LPIQLKHGGNLALANQEFVRESQQGLPIPLHNPMLSVDPIHTEPIRCPQKAGCAARIDCRTPFALTF
jgi:hypothetical protein